jgi:hypothetical protein
VPPNAQFFERDDLFGKVFHDAASPEINAEIKAAGNCLAADLNTAAVFHLIRAAEFGLREFVIHFKADKHFPKQLEEWDWHQLIEAADKEVNPLAAKKLEAAAAAAPKSPGHPILALGSSAAPPPREKAKWYRIALSEFRILKDVWRNDVMHTRATYTVHGAMDVYCRVRDFMPRLQRYLKD